MDIKTKLKDESLFMSAVNLSGKTTIINYLSKRGIVTIEDLIKCSPKDFRGPTKSLYNAIIEVYRHEFLGEPLVSDVLFEKEYEYSEIGCDECHRDLNRLGLRFIAHLDIYPSGYYGNLYQYFTDDYWIGRPNDRIIGNTFNIERLLRDGIAYAPSIDLAGFYLRYIEQKRKEQQSNKEIDDSTTLSDLKKQFQSLLKMRDNLDEQIKSIQESIERIERGESGNVRK